MSDPSPIESIPDCWAKLDECATAQANDEAACDRAHAQRTASCTVTCTAFTNCDAIQCTSYTNCAAIQCNSYTNCNDYWATDPRRYACWTARGVCVAAKAIERAACAAARALCVAQKAVERAACTVGRTVCVASAAAATALCVAGSLGLLVACRAAALAKSVACRTAAVLIGAACTAAKLAVAVVQLFVKAAQFVADIVSALVPRGPGPILRSTARQVPSVRRPTASARSFALTSDRPRPEGVPPYDEEGVPVAYEIVDGVVHWAVGTGGALTPLAPVAADLPPFATAPGAGPLAVSYHHTRRGDWSQPPPMFDMVAASGDRAMVKVVDADRMFICVPYNPYVHTVDGARILLPQSYFKLDPELGRSNAQIADLVAHVRIPGDDERHPATERFPLFRALFELGEVRIRVPQIVRTALKIEQLDVRFRLFKGASELGLMQEMDVWFVPRVWHELDLRPPRNGNEPPQPPDVYPTYEHVVYATGNPRRPELARHSIRYERVLDLAVGLSHLHEQHDNRFGGEVDNLSDERWKILGIFPTDISNERAYQFANGPIQDYGGWVDGTCIYYMLVQLKPTPAIDERDLASLRNAFAILWIDEQSAFTERWRLLDLVDREFNSPFKPIVGVVTKSPADFYPGASFDAARYWSPFAAGHVTPASRMAVTRQIVVVTGRDPATGIDELYSTHFAWPTMDRTWRWRPVPTDASTLDAGGISAGPGTVLLREDTTILLQGSTRVGGEIVHGRWFQRYLPADGQELPSVADRAAEPVPGKPGRGYTHPWDFMSEAVFGFVHPRFSHLGVYEPVRSRVQCYRLTNMTSGELRPDEVEATAWQDRGHALRIMHGRLDWTATADVLRGDGGALARAATLRSHPSIYNDPMAFRVVHRPGLGWLLMHLDVRDDKLIPFDGAATPALRSVVLTDGDDPRRTITVAVGAHLRNAVRNLHGLTVADEVDAVSPPQVRSARVTTTLAPNGDVGEVKIALTLARGPEAKHAYTSYGEWVAMNVWRVKVGAIVPGATDEPGGTSAVAPLVLFDAVREDVFAATTPTTFQAVWSPTSADQRGGLLATVLTPAGHVRYGTSVWFVGATGFACCADETDFASG
jgi:hypothetical protein